MTDISTLEKMGFSETYFLYLTSSKNETRFELEEPLKNVVSVEVHSALIPRAAYTIETGKTDLLEYRLNGQQWTKAELTERDYDLEDLKTELNSIFLTNNDGITVSVEDGKNKLKFTSTTSFKFNIETSTCLRALGFQKTIEKKWDSSIKTFIDSVNPKTVSSVVKSNEHVIVSDNRCNLMGTEVILLESDLDVQLNHGKNNEIGAPLAVFYISDSSKSQFTQDIHGIQPRPFFPISSLSKLNLKFKCGHDSDNLYNFNGVQWYIHLVVKCGSFGKDWSTIGNAKGVNDTQYILEQLFNYIMESTEPKKEKKKKIQAAPLTWKQKAALTAILAGGAYVGYKYYVPNPTVTSPFL
jgi:hypothetical protein